jgi:hypothetical protein
MLGSNRTRGLLLALPLLLAMAPREAEDCTSNAWPEAHIDPILLSDIESGRRVHVEDNAVVAEEAVQIAQRGWMLGAALDLPGEGMAFPAGTILSAQSVARQPHCLPLAPSDAEAAVRRFPMRGRLACLIDGNGDGAFEQVQMFGADYAMHVPQARPYRLIALPAPVRLVENPLGQPETRRHILRRIEIGPVRGGTAVLRVLHAFRDAPPAGEGGIWDREASGAMVFRLTQPAAVPIDRSDNGWSSNTSEERIVTLADQAQVEVGGLRLRIERPSPSSPPGWNIVTLAPYFPRWVHYGCGGRSVRLGIETG